VSRCARANFFVRRLALAAALIADAGAFQLWKFFLVPFLNTPEANKNEKKKIKKKSKGCFCFDFLPSSYHPAPNDAFSNVVVMATL
jgi:hypothetical protein